MRWLLILALTFLVFNGLQGWLERIGLGRVPGDFKVRMGGRDWYFPFGSTVVLSVIGWWLAKLL